jgi:uncharacterized protein (DUF58 family)
MKPGRLLDPEALGRYDGLALRVAHGMGDRPGERRFPGRPQVAGVEIESYAAYAPGDDLRHLDWNALGRLDALLVRRFTAEREVVFHLLLDASASMGVPPDDGKLAAALELAMALGYVALSAGDAVRVAVLAGGAPARVSPAYRQRASVVRLAGLLDGVRAAGPLALAAALDDYARRHRRPGAAILVSDLMTEPAEVERAVLALRARRFEVCLLHVIGASELDPTRHFDRGLLLDPESGATHPVVATAAALARYRALLGEHLDALAGLAARAGALYARLATGTPVGAFVIGELARLGMVRRR